MVTSFSLYQLLTPTHHFDFDKLDETGDLNQFLEAWNISEVSVLTHLYSLLLSYNTIHPFEVKLGTQWPNYHQQINQFSVL